MSITRLIACGWSVLLVAASAFAAELKVPLADAAERGDFPAIRQLLEQQHVDVDASQPDGMTALHWSVYRDDQRAAIFLVDVGADLNAKNRYGVSPLSLACVNGNATIVELLLAAGADPNTALHGGETALMTAARTGRIRVVELLLAQGADVNAKESTGQTALMWAAADGHREVVRALIKAGADFRTPLKSGFTPLFFAARNGRSEVVFALLDAGVDVNEGMRAERRRPLGPGRDTSPLMLAIENGHFELAAALLDAGADPNDQRSGFTPLHAISWVRKPNSGDDDGQPAPEGSGKLSSLDFVRYLVAHGADVNAQLKRGASGRGKLNQKGATPFLMAADTADVPLMKLLIELGADPLLPNADHATPLMAAAGLGTLAPGEEAGTDAEALEAAQLALDLGGDVNAVDDNGETAMHGAAYKSLPKMVEWLADQGANEEIWHRKNKYGWTPLLIARGYRPGNFKPSAETIDAIERISHTSGVAGSDDPPNSERGY